MDSLISLKDQRSHIQKVYKHTLGLYKNGTSHQREKAKKKLKELENKLSILDEMEGSVMLEEFL